MIQRVFSHSRTAEDFAGPEPTAEELADRKRLSDRAELLDHVDSVLRPPAWIYDELEDAIELAITGRMDAVVESREGDLLVSELVERWELGELLPAYRRDASDPSYEPAGRGPAWPGAAFL